MATQQGQVFRRQAYLVLAAHVIHPRFTPSLPKSRPLLSSAMWKVKHRRLPPRERASLSYERAKTIGLAYSQCFQFSVYHGITSSILFTRYYQRRSRNPFPKILGLAYRPYHLHRRCIDNPPDDPV